MRYTPVRRLLDTHHFAIDLARADDATVVELREIFDVSGNVAAYRAALVEEHVLLASVEDPRWPRVLDVIDEGRITVFAHQPSLGLDDVFAAAKGGVAFPFIASVAAEVAELLVYLHERDLRHRHLTPETIRLTFSGNVCVVATPLADFPPIPPTLTGPGPDFNFGYSAPETIRDRVRNEASDVFCLAVVMYELSTGTRAFAHENMVMQAVKIIQMDLASIDVVRPDLPPEWTQLVKSMMTSDLNTRPTAAAVRDMLRRELKWAMWTAEQRADELRALLPERFDT